MRPQVDPWLYFPEFLFDMSRDLKKNQWLFLNQEKKSAAHVFDFDVNLLHTESEFTK